MILTLSHPININRRLVQEVRQNINVINRTIKKVNFFTPGSSTMYTAVNKRIDHRTRYPSIKKETLKKSNEKIYLFISHLALTSRVKVDTLGKVHIDSPVSALIIDA